MNEVLCGSLAERRRLEIIEAAERCVMKTGLHRLTLRDIARANQRLYEVISNDVINNRQNSWPIPKAKMQAQLALSRSLLEGLRVTAIFNPGIDRKELRAVAIDRLVHGILADLAASKGVTVEELSRWP